MNSKRYYMSNILFGIALLVIATGAFIYGFNDRLSFLEKSSDYETIEANVIDYDYNDNNKAAEIVEYTINENTYVYTLGTYTNDPKDINSKVNLKYNTSNPEDIIYNTNYAIYVVILVGLIVLSLSIIIIVRNYLFLKRFS